MWREELSLQQAWGQCLHDSTMRRPRREPVKPYRFSKKESQSFHQACHRSIWPAAHLNATR